jgi:hypothetical protein
MSKIVTGTGGELWLWEPNISSRQTFSHLAQNAWTTITDTLPGRSSASLRVANNKLVSLGSTGRLFVDTAVQSVPTTNAPTVSTLFQGFENDTWGWLVVSRGPGVMNEYLLRSACGTDTWQSVTPMGTSYDSLFSVGTDGTVLRFAQTARGVGRNLLRYSPP